LESSLELSTLVLFNIGKYYFLRCTLKKQTSDSDVLNKLYEIVRQIPHEVLPMARAKTLGAVRSAARMVGWAWILLTI
jgi:hypothetical protein